MPSSRKVEKIVLPANILKDIEKMGTTRGKEMPAEVLNTIKAARGMGLSWMDTSTVLKKHYPKWGLSFSTLVRRNRKYNWGLGEADGNTEVTSQ
jgi:hypothetical protein